MNWDPVDQTVLANEQVIDGRGWRSGALVEQREQPEWVFKITDYAQDLLDALQTLDRWPEKVRLMQANWIGRSEGLLIRFEVAKDAPEGQDIVEVFTTRPDTLFGASFLGLAPDHPLSKAIAARDAKAASFIAECQHHGTSAAEHRDAREEGIRHGLARETSGHRRRRASRLHRQFHPHGVRHRRHLRLPGARSARPRICACLWAPRDARRAAA